MSTATVGIVDYGMGNRRSVEKALERVGARVLLTGDHDALNAADGLIVPGVGAFPAAMDRLPLGDVDRGIEDHGAGVTERASAHRSR